MLLIQNPHILPNSIGRHFDHISKKLGKICEFFNISIFLGHMSFSGTHTVHSSTFKKNISKSNARTNCNQERTHILVGISIYMLSKLY